MKAFIKVEDTYPENKKIVAVGPLAMALHLAALAYCNRNLTDGFLPTRTAKLLVDVDGFAFNGAPVTVQGLLQQLVGERLLEVCDGGYMVHDYLEHQSSKEHIETVRKERAIAGSKGGSNKVGRQAKTKQIANDLLQQSSSKSQAEEEVIKNKEEVVVPPQTPPLTAEPERKRPGDNRMTPEVQRSMALQEYLLEKCATLTTGGNLSKAQVNEIRTWFTTNKHALTAEWVDYAVSQTALYARPDSLVYFFQVLADKLAGGGRKTNGRGGKTTMGAVGEMPPPGHSWEQYPDRSWKPHIPDPQTGLYPYGLDNLDDVLERDKRERAVFLARKQGLSFAEMPDGERIPVNSKRTGTMAVA